MDREREKERGRWGGEECIYPSKSSLRAELTLMLKRANYLINASL